MQCLEATKERFSMRSKKLLHKSFRFPGPWLLHGPTTGGRLCKALLTLFQLSSASIQVFEKKNFWTFSTYIHLLFRIMCENWNFFRKLQIPKFWDHLTNIWVWTGFSLVVSPLGAWIKCTFEHSIPSSQEGKKTEATTSGKSAALLGLLS